MLRFRLRCRVAVVDVQLLTHLVSRFPTLLNKHNLSIAKFCSKENSRYEVGGVLITDVETVATDGHTLVRVSTPEVPADQFPEIEGFKAKESWKPFILPREAALRLAKELPSKDTVPALACAAVGDATDAGTEAVFATTDLETKLVVSVRKPDGQFPNWKQVVPSTDDAKATITLNANYLKELFSAIAAFTKGDTLPLATLRFFASEGALRVDASNEAGQYFTGVIMPVQQHCEVKESTHEKKEKKNGNAA